VNAVVGGFFNTEVFQKDEEEMENRTKNGTSEDKSNDGTNGALFDWSSPLDEVDDSDLYFTPDSGNVLFASAVDGWGFG
jgi:ribosome assembly protein 1